MGNRTVASTMRFVQPNLDAQYVCPKCYNTEHLYYEERQHVVTCSECKLSLSVEDITRGKFTRMVNTLSDEQLNDMLGEIILNPDRLKGYAVVLIGEIERRRSNVTITEDAD